jgi:hypothetical protein
MTTKRLFAAIAELRAYAQELDQTIAALECLPHRGPGRPPKWLAEARQREAWINRPKRRGRKSMGTAERQEVSDRMKKYWAARLRKPLSGPRTAGADLTKVKIPTGQRID